MLHIYTQYFVVQVCCVFAIFHNAASFHTQMFQRPAHTVSTRHIQMRMYRPCPCTANLKTLKQMTSNTSKKCNLQNKEYDKEILWAMVDLKREGEGGVCKGRDVPLVPLLSFLLDDYAITFKMYINRINYQHECEQPRFCRYFYAGHWICRWKKFPRAMAMSSIPFPPSMFHIISTKHTKQVKTWTMAPTIVIEVMLFTLIPMFGRGPF